MKPKSLFVSSSVLAAVIVLPAFADSTPSAATDSSHKNPAAWAKQVAKAQKVSLGPISPADELIGREVRNDQDEKLGKVEDLAMDPESGRIAQVIVSSGGFLGIGDRLSAVPPAAFQTLATSDALRLNVSKERFKGAPVFVMEHWDDMSDATKVAEVYSYYGAEPYFAVAESKDAKTDDSKEHLGRLFSAKSLVGSPVKNGAGETIGDVKGLLVDSRNARINQVLVSVPGLRELEGQVCAVPPEAFRFSKDTGGSVLDVTKLSFLDAPRFEKDKWAESQDTASIVRVYESYKVEPYFDPNAPIVWTEADHSPDKHGNYRTGITAEDQGTSESDIEITRNIRKAIVAKEGFSMNAQNVKIITDDGEVTLKGPVNSQWEKKAIEDLAAAVVDRSKIDNQLEVKASVVSR